VEFAPHAQVVFHTAHKLQIDNHTYRPEDDTDGKEIPIVDGVLTKAGGNDEVMMRDRVRGLWERRGADEQSQLLFRWRLTRGIPRTLERRRCTVPLCQWELALYLMAAWIADGFAPSSRHSAAFVVWL
jgi:hypothetical protein